MPIGMKVAGSFAAIVIGLTLTVFSPRGEMTAGPPVQSSVAPNAPAEVRLQRRGNGHFFVHGMVDGQIVEFMVDTGASDVVLTIDDAERVGIPVDRKRFRAIGSGAGGVVRGQISPTRTIEVEGRILANAEVMIADGLEQSLLGQDFLRRFGSLQMNGERMVLR